MAKRVEFLTVKDNRRLNSDLFILELTSGEKLPELKPGQFAQVKVEGSPETFLRRPISIHDVDYAANSIKMLVQIAGKGTSRLSKLEKGEKLDIVYPLGNYFTIPERDKRILLAGGGCGVAPLLFLGRYMKSLGLKPEILLGFRDSERIIEYEEYESIGPVYLTTEDGSRGESGYITGHSILEQKHFDNIYCCGPEPMMKAVAGYCSRNGIDCEVSLEHLMACGFGVCLCCIVDTVRGNLCTCTEGPVFNIKDLKW
jgi:dihydroorotate dehydrogenase electron transfer subunit